VSRRKQRNLGVATLLSAKQMLLLRTQAANREVRRARDNKQNNLQASLARATLSAIPIDKSYEKGKGKSAGDNAMQSFGKFVRRKVAMKHGTPAVTSPTAVTRFITVIFLAVGATGLLFSKGSSAHVTEAKCTARLKKNPTADGILNNKNVGHLLVALLVENWRSNAMRAVLLFYADLGTDAKTIKNTIYALKAFGTHAFDMNTLHPYICKDTYDSRTWSSTRPFDFHQMWNLAINNILALVKYFSFTAHKDKTELFGGDELALSIYKGQGGSRVHTIIRNIFTYYKKLVTDVIQRYSEGKLVGNSLAKARRVMKGYALALLVVS
jgi:hypothetical protein